MSDDFFGLKKRQRVDAAAEGIAFTFEERAELFDDLLEDDVSSFPLLEAPHEVLAVVGSFLDAGHLAALSELCTAAHLGLEEAFAESWTCLLLRDHMPRSRAKRYRAYGVGAVSDDTSRQRAGMHSAGVVLTAVDLSRVEWDGMLVAAPSNLRYRFLQAMGVLKSRWGRHAQSWEWFATRIMHRTTYAQLERLVPGFGRPSGGAEACGVEEFDEVAHRASLDKDLRARHRECNPSDVIASMKRSLGIVDQGTSTGDAASAAAVAPADAEAVEAVARTEAEDVLSAMAPTARDQRLQEAAAERIAAAAVAAGEQGSASRHTTDVAGGSANGTIALPGIAVMPALEVVERMSFSEQLDLAMKISQNSTGEDPVTATQAQASPTAAAAQTVASNKAELSTDKDHDGDDDAVLLRLGALGKTSSSASDETIDVVLRDFTVGDALAVPEQLRRSLEQITLRLTREDWLLFYEGIAMEAQLRARTVAHRVRAWWLSIRPPVARRLVDLEAEMLQLPIFGRNPSCGSTAAPSNAQEAGWRCAEVANFGASPSTTFQQARGRAGVGATHDSESGREEEEEENNLRRFLEHWEEYEAWASSLEEHLGPLDLEISRERTNNLQRGKAHTPYSADLLRLAFRNFAICEGRLFFAIALAVYGAIGRLCTNIASPGTSDLLEALHTMAKAYGVQDDALADQRGTLQEYRYYLLEPLRRACGQLDLAGEVVDEAEEDIALVGKPPRGVGPEMLENRARNRGGGMFVF